MTCTFRGPLKSRWERLQRGTASLWQACGYRRTDPTGRPSSFNIQFYRDFDLRHYSFVRDHRTSPTVFWRRSLTERIGPFDTTYRLIGDCEDWLRAALSGAELTHIQELLALQVEHASTLRMTERARLHEEFEYLRQAMATVVRPPSSLRFERLKRSVSWRARQLEFFFSMKARRSYKWSRFVATLRAHGLDVVLHDLRALAPARWRGDASLFGDANHIFEILGGKAQP